MLDRLVTVATFDDSIRAALARNHLEAEGISVVLNDELTVATDWSLSTAVGGIKLQVPALQVEHAEYLLAVLAEARADVSDVHFTTTAETAHELAEEREAQREEENPSNQLADRAFRAAVGGFLFFPLHFYVWLLLLSLLGETERVSPNRRWKVWGAVFLNLPVIFGLSLLVVFLTSLLPRSPDDHFAHPHWHEQGFVPFGHEVWLNFPNPHGAHSGDVVLGDGEQVLSRNYETRVKSQQFGLDLVQYPPTFRGRTPEQLYREEVQLYLNQCNDGQGQPLQAKNASLAGHAGQEYLLPARDGRLLRCRMFLVDLRLYSVYTIGTTEEVRNELAAEFFASFSLR
jgi:hypothetical protein